MEDRFSRSRMLLGDAAMDRLASARVAVFGVGGVGGYVVEALTAFLAISSAMQLHVGEIVPIHPRRLPFL